MKYLTADNIAIVTGGLLALSEILSLIPSVKANGVFQLIVNILRKIGGKDEISTDDPPASVG